MPSRAEQLASLHVEKCFAVPAWPLAITPDDVFHTQMLLRGLEYSRPHKTRPAIGNFQPVITALASLKSRYTITYLLTYLLLVFFSCSPSRSTLPLVFNIPHPLRCLSLLLFSALPDQDLSCHFGGWKCVSQTSFYYPADLWHETRLKTSFSSEGCSNLVTFLLKSVLD